MGVGATLKFTKPLFVLLLLVAAQFAHATITKVQSWTVSMTGTSPVTSVPTSNLTPGSLLTVQAGLWGNNTQPNLGASDTTNGTWHVAVEGKFTTSPGDLQNGSIGYVKNSSAGKPTISVASAAGPGDAFTAAVITEWTTDQSWASGTGALDVTANNANNSTIAQPSTGTTGATTGTGAMVVLAVGTSASSTITSTSNGWNTPSGYTSLFLQNDTTVDTSITAAFKLLTTGAGAQGATYTADFSTAPSVDWAACIAVFKETTGGGTTTQSRLSLLGVGP